MSQFSAVVLGSYDAQYRCEQTQGEQDTEADGAEHEQTKLWEQ